MRLLNVDTLDFEEFMGESEGDIPPYAILSHTWDTEEISYKDYIEQESLSKKGYSKIHRCCEIAKLEGFHYVWIDTCCIDKSSSAELSEAINSMFQWYHDAGICYTYLSDVDGSDDPTVEASSFACSRWFTRGWTLQELLAPAEVVFLNSDWEEIGTKKSLLATVSFATGISRKALDERSWTEYSIAQKMSWAATRRTTRPEDRAYCLMGLFGVNMPLLYGEGHKSFLRLQEEILKRSDDQSIFAWSYPTEEQSHTRVSGLIAPSPEYFKDASQIEQLAQQEHEEEYEHNFEVVNHLIRITVRLLDEVKAMRIERLECESRLHKIVEVRQQEMKNGSEQPKEAQRLPTVPSIIINSEEESGKIAMKELVTSSGFPKLSPAAVRIDSGLHRTNNKMPSLWDDFNSNGLGDEQDKATNCGSWHWFIYEPVIVIPLRCHIGGHQLGIVLSRMSSLVHRGILSRLHNPSIITTEAIRKSQLTPLVTKYAAIVREVDHHWGDKILQSFFQWPQIRIGSLLSAGYTVHETCGLGWSFDSSRRALVQKQKYQSQYDMTESAPLAIFYRVSSHGSLDSAFFISIPAYEESVITCEVGLLNTRKAKFMVLEYELYTTDLASERISYVLLENSQAIVVKYRAGERECFISLSVETLKMMKKSAKSRTPEVSRSSALNSKLLPALRLLYEHP